MNHIGFFEGIGGFSLAAEMVGWNTIAWCEINEFCQRILKYHFPNAQGYSDITKTDFSLYRGKCQIVTGGFPCQGFSFAGKRLGTDDNRYLWPEMLRGIKEINPPFVIGENVTGILSMEDKTGVWREIFPVVENRTIVRYENADYYEAIYTRQAKMLISTICEDLEREGYEVQAFAIPAAAVKAPHKRERIWIIAYNPNTGNESVQSKRENRIYKTRFAADTNSIGSNRRPNSSNRQKKSKGFGDRLLIEANRFGTQQPVTNSKFKRLQRYHEWKGCTINRFNKRLLFGSENKLFFANPISIGQSQPGKSSRSMRSETLKEWKASWTYDDGRWPTQSPICTRNDGFPCKLDFITVSNWRIESIKGAGNAVVPELVVKFYEAINEVYQLVTNK